MLNRKYGIVTGDLTNAGAKNSKTPVPSCLNGIATNALHSKGSGCLYSNGMRIILSAVNFQDLKKLG
jgi:hypothetical protein